ncbi:mitochondrial inner membrane protease subunit 1 [Adelges cooleyi]|uniref:mitochondrial inner membrane protease subunit 1 n=1 Tax=Adelges cooleyi TaxID=133065 RepID=UPI00217F7BB7|nr:mitochondrial inner membrane protease subunit 1 [Adelges cooleyi]
MLQKASNTVFNCFKYYCVFHCVTEHVVDVVICSGESMEPSIQSGDIVIIQRFSKVFNNVDKGDMILAKSPNENKLVVKRIQAMDGQTVRRGMRYRTVPKGSVWLEGDNKNNSLDSWHYGPVPKGLICGRVLCRIWPLSNFTLRV